MGGLKADVNNTYQPDNPNQWWRFITPLVFHLGFIHLTLVVVFQLFVGWSIEKTAGWLRVFLIYFISGIGGYIVRNRGRDSERIYVIFFLSID